MDGYANRLRREEGRHDIGRSYAGITVGESQNERRDYHGVGAAVNALFSAPGFGQAAGIIAGFQFLIPAPGSHVATSPSGHAVGIYWRAANAYDFLDPNYGVFRYTTQQAVTSAIRYLFETVYQRNHWVVLSSAGVCKMRYSVFLRASAANAS